MLTGVRGPGVQPGRRCWRILLCVLPVSALAGCAADGIGYYWQSVSGHIALMQSARPLEEAIQDDKLDANLRNKLSTAREARSWAVQALALPDNGSYTAYADIGRASVLWNVFATGALSLQLKTWCFPVAGCVGYRGYYDEQRARSYAQELAAQSLDVRVGGVPAYSTLGWFDDPLPSPVLRYPETEVVRLIFHELAHQVLYLKGDSGFNEAFATAVEEVGVDRWLTYREAAGADQQIRERYQLFRARKSDFLVLLRRTKARLQAIYAGDEPDEIKLKAKQRTFDLMRNEYAELKKGKWGGYGGYDRWFAQSLGNAHLAAVGAYNDRVPAFLGMLDEVQGDFPRFYELVRKVSKLEPAERNRQLDQWQSAYTERNNKTGPDAKQVKPAASGRTD